MRHSVDTAIERRVGLRFMSDHDQKIQVPFMTYLTAYASLTISEASMFSQSITVLGNPKYQPGQIIAVDSQNADYFCTEVVHDWSMDGGYKTQLALQYGRTHGTFLLDLTGYSNYTVADAKCTKDVSFLAQYGVTLQTYIGDVSVFCLVWALWYYMTQACPPPPPNRLNQYTKEYAQANQISGPLTDWILPSPTNSQFTTEGVSGLPISNFIPILKSAITNNPPAAQYNITPTLLSNIVASESSWGRNMFNASGATGWFQLLSVPSAYNSSLTGAGAISAFTTDANSAVKLLNQKFSAEVGSNYNSSNGSSYLQAVNDYGENTEAYIAGPNGVFGQTQVANIRLGTQNPGTTHVLNLPPGMGVADSADLEAWPFYVYGPLGIQIDEARKVQSVTGSDASIKNMLLTNYNQSMNTSISYIKQMLTKYQLQDFRPTDPAFKILGKQGNQDLLSKAVAAWYCDEQNPVPQGNKKIAVDYTAFNTVLGNIKTLYQECLLCSNAQPKPLSNLDSEEMLPTANITFQVPLQSSSVTVSSAYCDMVGRTSPHVGIDLVGAGNVGNPLTNPWNVVAAATGKVVIAGPDTSYGNWIVIQHNSSVPLYTIYGHVDNISVAQNTPVTQGQQIAQITSRPVALGEQSTGPHLHFQVQQNGIPLSGQHMPIMMQNNTIVTFPRSQSTCG